VAEGIAMRNQGGWARTRLVCAFCGTARAPDLDPACAGCGGSLRAVVATPLFPAPPTKQFWDYAPMLPVGARRVTMGEGGTPLLKLKRLFPNDEVYVKAEWMNPTGSFKDRGTAIAVSAALQLGAVGLVCASSGNTAASVSAYTARAGLPCIVTLAKGTPINKVIQAKSYGAIVVEVEGTVSDAYREAENIRAANPGWANLTTTYLNPYMTAAHATILYESIAAIGRIGSIIAPIGAGPMLDGIMQGAEQALAAGVIDRLPVPVGVQSAGCAPIADAFARGAETVDAWEAPVVGMSGSINDPLRGYPQDGTRTLRVIRAASGHAIGVSDDEIKQSMLDLGRVEGITAEPAALTPLAALRRLPDLPRPVVLVASGHSLKDPAAQPAAGAPSLSMNQTTTPTTIAEQARRLHAERLIA
jgi:threonine synthase